MSTAIVFDCKIFPIENHHHFKKKLALNLTMQENTSLTKNKDQFSLNEVNALYDKGIFLFCVGKYEESIECFNQIISINPAAKAAFGYKGLALRKLNRHKDAVQCYKKALLC